MLAIVFYSVASLLLPVIIINAKEPVMDFSQLIPPTATTITIFPPAPVPAPAAGVGNSSPPSSPSHHQDMGIVYMTSQSKFSSFLDSILPTKKNSHRSLFSLSSYRRAWRLSLKRSSTVTSHRAATRMVVEEKPYKSRYSPRAASSMEEYDAYGFRQSISYNTVVLFLVTTVNAAAVNSSDIVTKDVPSAANSILATALQSHLELSIQKAMPGRDESDADSYYLHHHLPAIYKSEGATIITRCTVPNTAALTYDDGPFKYTDDLLDVLREKAVKATFFINGDSTAKLADYEDTVKRAYSEGHQIASHTWSHQDLRRMSGSQIRSEMTKHPTDANKGLNAFKAALGPNKKHNKKSHIFLAHDIIPATATTLSIKAIDYIKQRGYRIVTVGECLGKPECAWYRS
ncbi:hypothetical protein BGX23_000051 [Mortierella sp. AD031]|nr:hypothetical protein BGX23_000051 [Mortierella sp. AD031]